ncbi:TMV resistance protein N [Prunus persica]|uniref:TMV resistance protein N n=1 Tax=Prunus persica TaxID=3760 RepID=UPI0009AB8DEC|nr:TMV resistance protein N [Prunus persica]
MALVRTTQGEASSSNSSRCSSHRCSSYHMFMSFRGEDTRKTFTDHLYTALVNARFCTFWDNNELERGEDIKPELQKAIQQSQSSVIVFSKDYALSRWCLDELVMILGCKRTYHDHVVLLVFYDVDPYKCQNPICFEKELFLKSQALYESKFIKKIVKVVGEKLSCTPLSVAPFMFGMQYEV